MLWIVQQRDPAGDWSIIRATVNEQQEAMELASLYKQHNPHIRFRYGPADDCGEPLDEGEGDKPVEI
jgi:hypothetical protein